MNPIFDTALLRHHRVDYGPQVKNAGSPRRRAIPVKWLVRGVARVLAGRTLIHGRIAEVPS